MNLKQIAKEIVDKMEFKKDKRVLAILLQGSAVYGGIDKYSDVDLGVLVKKQIPKKERIKKIFKFADKVKNTGLKFGNRDIFFYKGVEINILYIDNIKRKFNNFTLYYSNVLFDPKKIIKKPQKLNKEKIRDIFHVFNFLYDNFDERLEKFATRKEWFEFNYYFISTFCYKMLEAIYILNNVYFFNLNHAFRDIKKMKIKPQNFEKKLEEILNYPCKKWKKKIELTRRLGKEVKKLIENKYGKFEIYYKK